MKTLNIFLTEKAYCQPASVSPVNFFSTSRSNFLHTILDVRFAKAPKSKNTSASDPYTLIETTLRRRGRVLGVATATVALPRTLSRRDKRCLISFLALSPSPRLK